MVREQCVSEGFSVDLGAARAGVLMSLVGELEEFGLVELYMDRQLIRDYRLTDAARQFLMRYRLAYRTEQAQAAMSSRL